MVFGILIVRFGAWGGNLFVGLEKVEILAFLERGFFAVSGAGRQSPSRSCLTSSGVNLVPLGIVSRFMIVSVSFSEITDLYSSSGG